jgi:hypothetical protein
MQLAGVHIALTEIGNKTVTFAPAGLLEIASPHGNE